MIRKISISHVDWNRTYEIDVEKGIKKIAKGTVTYGVPLALLGGTLAILGNIAQPETVVAYANLDTPTKIVNDVNISDTLLYWVRKYFESLRITDAYKVEAARNVLEAFKELR